MAAKEMYDYLSAATADYTTAELQVNPQEALTDFGEKEQYTHKFSDGQRGIVTMSDTSRFIVTLQWNNISTADAGTIMDFWHDNNKAQGMARSFYWHHPRDGHIYTVKFSSPLSTIHLASLTGRAVVSQIQLDVLGNKPA